MASWSNGRLDIFVRGIDNHLHRGWYYRSAWRGNEELGGVITSSPAAVAWGSGRLDGFARGADKQLHHIWYQNGWRKL